MRKSKRRTRRKRGSNIKSRYEKHKHNITKRANKNRSGIQALSTDPQKLLASLKARNPYEQYYSKNLPPKLKPMSTLPTIDTSKKFMPYVPGPRTPKAFVQDSFFANKMKPVIPRPRTPKGPNPNSKFGGKSRRKRRKNKKKTKKRRKRRKSKKRRR